MVENPLIFLGNDETKNNITPKFFKSKVIYFTTQAISDLDDPLDKSFILLSGNNHSAFLTAREIQVLNLNAALVV